MTLNNCPLYPPEVEDVAERLEEAIRAMLPVVGGVVEAVVPIVRPLWDAAKCAYLPPRWVHLATHAKKARVRKKYRARCLLRVMEVVLL